MKYGERGGALRLNVQWLTDCHPRIFFELFVLGFSGGRVILIEKSP